MQDQFTANTEELPRRRFAKNIPAQGGTVPRDCVICGRRYYSSPWDVKHGKKRRCKECIAATKLAATLPWEQIIAEYKSGTSIYALGKTYGAYPELLVRGIRPHAPIRPVHFAPPDVVDGWVTRYLSGESPYQIASADGWGHTTIKTHLIQRGIPIRDISAANRKYTVDHSFFDVIDAEPKAFFCGLLAADGCIRTDLRSGQSTVEISLQEPDLQILEAFRDAMKSDYPIRFQKKTAPNEQNQRSLSIASPQMVASLAKHGIVPRKTYSLGFPTTIPERLLRHWIRGFTDGDGTWMVPSLQYPRRFSYSVVGTREALDGVRSHLIGALGISTGVHVNSKRSSDVLHSVKWTGHPTVGKIFHYLYDDATVWMTRKRNKIGPYFGETQLTLSV